MTRPFIMFVTGVSGAGKSTIYRDLRKRPHVVARDIDEDGVPPVAAEQWRQYRVELLLHQALKSLEKDSTSTVICGMTFPHEVIWSNQFDLAANIWFIVLEISPDQIRSRLTERLQDPQRYGHMGGLDPDETVDADQIERIIQANVNLQPKLLRTASALRQGIILDTVSLDASETLLEVRKIMSAAEVA